jgi:hypothetical protein
MDGGAVTAELMRTLAFELQGRKLGSHAQVGAGAPGYDELDRYYRGTQPLSFLHPDVVRQVEGRLTSLSINWARVVIGSIEERLDVEGFRLGVDQTADDDLWRIWQANDLDEWSQLGHVDAMTFGRAFGLVWGDEGDPETPKISVESATQMTVKYRPGSRRIDVAAKVFRDPDGAGTIGWLYLPDSAQRYRCGEIAATLAGATWEKDGPALPNPLGVVPVVPLVNRARLTDLCGESELIGVLPLVDAVNKLATDMMVASEKQAMGDRYATGIEVPREAQANARLREEVKAKWDEATKGKTWLAGPGVEFGQFPAAQLTNFIAAIEMFQRSIAALAGLPPHYVGQASDNPASADAIRSAEASLIKRTIRKMRGFGGSWEELMRLAMCVRDGIPREKLDRTFDRLETQWRDPATPTPAQKADAAMKLVSGDRPIITVNQAREDLGYTPGQIARMNQETEAAQAAAATADVRARVDQANQLMTDQGLSQPAAFAAVGLLAAASQMTPSVASGGQPAN